MDFFAQSTDVSLIILSCLQNNHKSHESIVRGVRKGVSPKTFVRKWSKKPNSIKCVISNKSKF